MTVGVVAMVVVVAVVVVAVSSVAISPSHSKAATESPSGAPMPTHAPPGWTEVFSDDFSASSMRDDPLWKTYLGKAGAGWWNASHDVITGGELKLESYKSNVDRPYGEPAGSWVSGGVSSSRSFSQTYGKYEVRFRMDRGAGIGGVILLWPADNSSTPEIDFSEDRGARARDETYATLHYGANDTQVQKSIAVDLAQWHTLGVEWTKGKLVFTLDGRDWATITNSNVSSVPMVLDMQTANGECGTWNYCADSSTPREVDMDIDWVVLYAPTSSATRQEAITRTVNRASRHVR